MPIFDHGPDRDTTLVGAELGCWELFGAGRRAAARVLFDETGETHDKPTREDRNMSADGVLFVPYRDTLDLRGIDDGHRRWIDHFSAG